MLRRFDRDVAVASIQHLIAMKRSTGREKDAAHVTVLLKHVDLVAKRRDEG